MKPPEPVRSCDHPEGLRSFGEGGYLCASCGEELDGDGLLRWVREAELSRDATYSIDGDDGFRKIVLEERQREVYRRRKVAYALQSEPRVGRTARPEMVLVTHDPDGRVYECRIFYKAPRPENAAERFTIAAETSAIMDLRLNQEFVLRVVAGKVAEFHEERERILSLGEPAPGRRVFYAGEM